MVLRIICLNEKSFMYIKKCNKCLIEKDIFLFVKNKKKYENFCKECHKFNERIRRKKLKEEQKYIFKENKKCWCCNKIKEREEFYINKGNYDGLHSTCKECQIFRSKVSSQRLRKEDPEKFRLYVNKRRAKKLEQYYDYFKSDWEYAKSHFNNCCAYCGLEKKLCKDHIISSDIYDGQFVPKNIIPVCRNCNSKKTNKRFINWYLDSKEFDFNRFEKIVYYVLNARESFEQNRKNAKSLMYGFKDELLR